MTDLPGLPCFTTPHRERQDARVQATIAEAEDAKAQMRRVQVRELQWFGLEL